jgi:hypothetical protein
MIVADKGVDWQDNVRPKWLCSCASPNMSNFVVLWLENKICKQIEEHRHNEVVNGTYLILEKMTQSCSPLSHAVCFEIGARFTFNRLPLSFKYFQVK